MEFLLIDYNVNKRINVVTMEPLLGNKRLLLLEYPFEPK